MSALAPAFCVFFVSDILTLESSAVVSEPGAVLLVLSLCLSLVGADVVFFVSGRLVGGVGGLKSKCTCLLTWDSREYVCVG